MKDLLKVFFATDVHGSDIVWKKWLNVPRIYNVDVLILAGDLTGKAIVPIIEKENGIYECKLFDRKFAAHTEKELRELEETIGRVGYYPYITTLDGVDDLRENPKKLDELFKKLIIERMSIWLELIEEKVPPGVKVIVMPGNDDIFEIDDVIKANERVIYPLGPSINAFYDYVMVSLDYTNPTPWRTPREMIEEKLKEKLEILSESVSTDWSKVICNFHCPPYGTHIDLAPKLDKNLKVVSSAVSPTIQDHVGSKAIFEFIREKQPLIGLHGHIHEAAGFDIIGTTRVFNPGSEYTEGILRGYIFEFTKEKLVKWWKVSG